MSKRHLTNFLKIISRFFNTTYRQGLVSLQKFVMVMFEKDTMVIPKESEWFGFYTPGQAKEITELTSSRIYLDPEVRIRFTFVIYLATYLTQYTIFLLYRISLV